MTIFWTFAAFAFALGAVVGSFLNVVIYRVPAGKSVVTPGSHCPICGHAIRWYDNVPILSWALLLRARCRDCAAPIPARYALVETLTGLLTLALWFKIGWRHFQDIDLFNELAVSTLAVPFGFYFFFICLLVVVTFVDLDHYLIPHEFTFPGMAIGIAAAFALSSEHIMAPGSMGGFWPPVTPSVSIIGLLVGGLTVVVIFVLYYAIRGAEGIGGGDVTLMAVMGAWLGWPSLVFIFFAASFQGVIAAGIGHLMGGRFLKHSAEIIAEHDAAFGGEAEVVAVGEPGEQEEQGELVGGMAVPFGPFIALAGLEYFFLGEFLPAELTMSYIYGIW
ncbi:MAG: prepilin peptidase [Bradymonadaceae bacterium]|nr:prepilin peptidase [Lujinxingiaceae bacterium]